MVAVVNRPKKIDSSWELRVILGVNLGMLPVFASLLIIRLSP